MSAPADIIMGYVIIDVNYTEDMSEGWIFAGNIPEGLILTEDSEGEDCEYSEFGVVRQRKWAGEMTQEAIDKLRQDWDMRHEDSEPNLGMLTEYGHLGGDRFNFDGSEWNSGGWTPIFEVTVSICDRQAIDS